MSPEWSLIYRNGSEERPRIIPAESMEQAMQKRDHLLMPKRMKKKGIWVTVWPDIPWTAIVKEKGHGRIQRATYERRKAA